MLMKRVIPCLDVHEGRVVKGVNFVNLRDAGDPVEMAAIYDKAGADEVVFLDITATHEERPSMLDVATHGWQRTSEVRALDLARELASLGVRRFIYTDIHQDGTLTEPGYDSTLQLVTGLPVPVIASGGVSRIEHLRRLQTIGVEGAIVGRALYAGTLSLRDAIAALAEG